MTLSSWTKKDARPTQLQYSLDVHGSYLFLLCQMSSTWALFLQTFTTVIAKSGKSGLEAVHKTPISAKCIDSISAKSGRIEKKPGTHFCWWLDVMQRGRTAGPCHQLIIISMNWWAWLSTIRTVKGELNGKKRKIDETNNTTRKVSTLVRCTTANYYFTTCESSISSLMKRVGQVDSAKTRVRD